MGPQYSLEAIAEPGDDSQGLLEFGYMRWVGLYNIVSVWDI